jgi:DNA-binding NtrC family response regulator
MGTNRAILCVDDEAIIVLAIKIELKRHFKDLFLYETANTAEEALDVIAELYEEGVSVILVLSDWLMPGMKGDEFLTVVKERYPEIKTILVTGNADKETTARLQRDDITDAIICKPWMSGELIAKVEECIAGL